MYGAILGDIIGSSYEFDRGSKTKDFPHLRQKQEASIQDASDFIYRISLYRLAISSMFIPLR